MPCTCEYELIRTKGNAKFEGHAVSNPLKSLELQPTIAEWRRERAKNARNGGGRELK